MLRSLRTRPSLQWPLHALGIWKAVTQTTQRERDVLATFARGRTSLAEIGVYQGVTTRCLASVMDPAGTYFAVDPYTTGRLGINFEYLIARREAADRAEAERRQAPRLLRDACDGDRNEAAQRGVGGVDEPPLDERGRAADPHGRDASVSCPPARNGTNVQCRKRA